MLSFKSHSILRDAAHSDSVDDMVAMQEETQWPSLATVKTAATVLPLVSFVAVNQTGLAQ